MNSKLPDARIILSAEKNVLLQPILFRHHLLAKIIQSDLRQIKCYHTPCTNSHWNLTCFYDDVHLCFCHLHQIKRLSNCFKYSHNMAFDCSGPNECENDGQCFQNSLSCRRECYYGFATNAFALSLDHILNYQLRPCVRFIHQTTIVKIRGMLYLSIIIIGMTNCALVIDYI
ncbi:unnamed protein product [Adineta ricciae]|uniref:Uncharacterized protein n=1 Tax=Adineta ricciae TaxID=249248 RepID=A0A816EU83_ADIRI|nr:unnamed protein product [Adineta ricciae]CAF1652684.1 unnamed protein product [Adineta ricciae]